MEQKHNILLPKVKENEIHTMAEKVWYRRTLDRKEWYKIEDTVAKVE